MRRVWKRVQGDRTQGMIIVAKLVVVINDSGAYLSCVYKVTHEMYH